MQASISVLIYGLDSTLNRSRELVLHHSGYQVCATSVASEFNLLVCNRQVDLLLLSDSLSLEECVRAIALASVWHPAIKSAVLASEEASYPAGVIYELVDPMTAPQSLVAAVSDLVGPAHAESLQMQ